MTHEWNTTQWDNELQDEGLSMKTHEEGMLEEEEEEEEKEEEKEVGVIIISNLEV